MGSLNDLELSKLTGGIIGVAIEVHRELGPGLYEKVYQRCLKIALEEAGFNVASELSVPIVYHGVLVDSEGYRMDLLVNNTIVLEIKSVSALLPLFEHQLITYLRLANKPCGLLINFNTQILKHGIKRIRNGFSL